MNRDPIQMMCKAGGDLDALRFFVDSAFEGANQIDGAGYLFVRDGLVFATIAAAKGHPDDRAALLRMMQLAAEKAPTDALRKAHLGDVEVLGTALDRVPCNPTTAIH